MLTSMVQMKGPQLKYANKRPPYPGSAEFYSANVNDVNVANVRLPYPGSAEFYSANVNDVNGANVKTD